MHLFLPQGPEHSTLQPLDSLEPSRDFFGHAIFLEKKILFLFSPIVKEWWSDHEQPKNDKVSLQDQLSPVPL